jgi:hypothetical protein
MSFQQIEKEAHRVFLRVSVHDWFLRLQSDVHVFL